MRHTPLGTAASAHGSKAKQHADERDGSEKERDDDNMTATAQNEAAMHRALVTQNISVTPSSQLVQEFAERRQLHLDVSLKIRVCILRSSIQSLCWASQWSNTNCGKA